MKKAAIFLFALLVLPINFAYAEPMTDCRVLDSTCSSNEKCWFSISDRSNAHVGSCGEYAYSICCTNTISAGVKPACSTREKVVVEIGKETFNAHAEEFFSFYNNYVCVRLEKDLWAPRFVEKNNPPADSDCVIGISSEKNAHAGDCITDQYFHGIYILKLPQIAAIGHSLEVKMNMAGTTDIVYIPGSGGKTHSELFSQDYGPENPYISSISPSNQAYMVMSSGKGALGKAIEKYPDSYGMEVQQEAQSGVARIVFSKGPLAQISERTAKLLKGSEVESFGYGILEGKIVMVGIAYGTIFFRNDRTLGPGHYELNLEHLGTRNKRIIIKVERL